MKIQCPQCGQTQDAPAQFCSKCGVRFVVQPKKKMSTTSVITIVIVLLIPFLCCGYLTRSSRQSAPNQISASSDRPIGNTSGSDLSVWRNSSGQTSAEALADVKQSLQKKDFQNDSGYYTLYTFLKEIPADAHEHAEAQKLIAQYKSQIISAMREINRDDYESLLDRIFPNFNGIKVKLVNRNGEYRLLGYHVLFTRYTLAAGPQHDQIHDWIDKNRDDLKMCGITKVGIVGTEDEIEAGINIR